MVRQLLEQRNRELLRELEQLRGLVQRADIPSELAMYRENVLERCDFLCKFVDSVMELLRLNNDDIIDDVISKTQSVTQSVRRLTSMGVVPILRGTSADRSTLKTIQWLHQSKAKTKIYPAVFMSGNIAVWPFVHEPPLYVFPMLEQRGLLYQPLLFHEYGHFLYALHKQEMDALVSDLRYGIDEALTPLSYRNSRYAEGQIIERQIIVDTWYNWAQELFCDAVGFAIGGPSYLYAFSNYLGLRDRGSYYRQKESLQKSAHPVTWLRIHFLTRQAIASGFSEIANSIENEWMGIARVLGVSEDYHGYYDPCLDEAIQETLQDMLEEADPRNYTPSEVTEFGWDPSVHSPVRLFNSAWQAYRKQPAEYAAWEESQIHAWLNQDQEEKLSE